MWGKLEGPRAGRAVAQAAAAASEAGSEKCGKVIDQICLSFSCCSIPPVFPHGLSRSHLGSLSQMDFFSPSVPLMMVRENDSSIREVCYFTTWEHFQSVSTLLMLKFPECFQREGPKCAKVQGNFRVFCAQK